MSIISIFNPKTDEAKLERIEYFVSTMGIFLFLVFFLDTYRHRTRNSAIKIPLLVLETINTSLLQYTVGLMQEYSFENGLLAMWAVLLDTARPDIDCVTAYGIPDAYVRRHMELSDIILSLLLANLTATLESRRFKALLWALWSVRPLQILTRIYYHDVAFNSYSQGRNSEFVAAYMKNECSKFREPNPTTMEGYEYFVWGENAQEIESNAPAHQFNIDVFNPMKCVTVDKIWRCPGRLLSYWDKQNRIKDVCLSYALYKIIRCQTEDILIPRECYHKMQNLIFRGILSKEGDRAEDDADVDDERIFRISEIETAFLNDYKRTRYPIIIWYGFPVINLIKCLVTSTISLWLATGLHNGDFTLNYKDGTSNKQIKVDRKITYVILSTIVLKAFWEIALCIFSDWMKIKVVCKYVLSKCLWRNRFFEHITWYLCTKNLVRRWCKKMPQYNILQRFNYRPYFKRAFYYGSMHITERPMEGAKLLRDIKIYREVKRSIVDALRLINTTGEIIEYMRPVYRDHIADEFKWACYQETCSHLIMVWHIATSMSEIELYISEQQKGRQGTRNCFPLSLSWIKTLFSREAPFLVDLKHLEDNNLRSNYISANAISRYCAYLLIFAPDLLPDNKILPRLIFENTVEDARYALASCNSFDSIYGKLMEIGQGQENYGEVMNRSIVKMGARLGYALITKMRSEDRWRMLSRFWANLLLYLAPSPVSSSHENYQQKGGEFITLLWALFTHCGISERQKEDVAAAANEEELVHGAINGNGTGGWSTEANGHVQTWRCPSR